MAKLKAALPLSATVSPPLLAQLQEQAPDLALSPRCQITGIHYAGRRRWDPLQTRFWDMRMPGGVLRVDHAPDL